MKYIFMFAIFLCLNSCVYSGDDMKDFLKPTDFNGRIATMYLDKNNRNTMTVLFTNGRAYPIYSSDLFSAWQVDDSLIKKKGSFKYLLYRNNHFFNEYYPTIDGREIR